MPSRCFLDPFLHLSEVDVLRPRKCITWWRCINNWRTIPTNTQVIHKFSSPSPTYFCLVSSFWVSLSSPVSASKLTGRFSVAFLIEYLIKMRRLAWKGQRFTWWAHCPPGQGRWPWLVRPAAPRQARRAAGIHRRCLKTHCCRSCTAINSTINFIL